MARNEVKKTLREAEKKYVQNEIYKIKNRMQCGRLLGDVCLVKRYHNLSTPGTRKN